MLFELPNKFKIDIDSPIIAENYTVIHFDEIPILYSGTNSMGNHVIGSVIGEDTDQEIIRYIHTIVTPKDYISFVKKNITYRELISRQKNIYLIDKNQEEEILATYIVNLHHIPEEYLPSPKLYCPNVEMVFGSDINFDLKGSIANVHEAIADKVADLTVSIESFLNLILDSIRLVGVRSNLRLVPYQPKSFGITFRIKHLGDKNVFINDGMIKKYITEAIDYSINELPFELDNLVDHNLTETKYELIVNGSIKNITDTLSFNYSPEVEQKVLKNFLKLPSEMQKIANQIGSSFTSIEISSSDNFRESDLGFMDRSFFDMISLAVEAMEDQNETVQIDSNPEEYRIHIYQLNTESRKGLAHIIRGEGDDSVIDKPRISIGGESNLEGSLFIDSLDTGRAIKVRAIARRVNGKYRYLTIEE